jgi:hypothetical protein
VDAGALQVAIQGFMQVLALPPPLRLTASATATRQMDMTSHSSRPARCRFADRQSMRARHA